MVGPEAFTEVRYLSYLRQLDALELIPSLATEFATTFGRRSRRIAPLLPDGRRHDDRVALGRSSARSKMPRTAVRDQGERVGVVGITTFRPFPFEEVRARCRRPRR